MAGLAGVCIEVCVESIILVEVVSMAVAAVHLVLIIQADGYGPSLDIVVFVMLAFDADKIVLSNMDFYI